MFHYRARTVLRIPSFRIYQEFLLTNNFSGKIFPTCWVSRWVQRPSILFWGWLVTGRVVKKISTFFYSEDTPHYTTTEATFYLVRTRLRFVLFLHKRAHKQETWRVRNRKEDCCFFWTITLMSLNRCNCWKVSDTGRISSKSIFECVIWAIPIQIQNSVWSKERTWPGEMYENGDYYFIIIL